VAHPKTKDELLAATARERDALQAFLGRLTRDQMLACGEYGWSPTDHLVHLAEWERLLFGWYEAGMRGEEPPVPAEGFGWADMDALNRQMLEAHRGETPEHALADWTETSGRLIGFTQAISETDLFVAGRFKWTGRETLASFVFECGANHYRWSCREIKKGLKARR
jgi:hypothetical protein